MSKIVIKKALLNRIKNAAANGSVVAQCIVEVLKNPNATTENCLNGKKNFFNSKRIINSDQDSRSRKIVITCCAKDLTNEKFVDKDIDNAMWLPGNRTQISVTDFAKQFTAVCARNFSQFDFEWFENIIPIDSKLTCILGSSFEDFHTAYNSDNYSLITNGDHSSLHHSCMGGEKQSACAADFYANFANTKIVYCQDEQGYIYGRALFWPAVKFYDDSKTYKVLDRVYVSFKFVEFIMKKFAVANGADFFKTENSACSEDKFTDARTKQGIIKDAYYELSLSRIDNYKGGAPYVDTFHRLGTLGNVPVLSNRTRQELNYMHDLQHTGGTQSVGTHVCPICGKKVIQSSSPLTLCTDCAKEHTIPTPFGPQFRTGLRAYYGNMYPEACFDKQGKPLRTLLLMSAIGKFSVGSH